ncbi:SDR family oxidoreductase [Shouchella sp. 1P09AA]|uniref:SDR family NAD(P)-dependent oxidoreductase n=1 Tax=unclassified Shouchella TaxID=2893065 RepID=UPI0039A0C063
MIKKVVVITGAASGIGRATAQLFSLNNYIVVVADRDKGGSEETVRLLKQQDSEAEATIILTDVSRENEVKELINKTVAKYNRIDVMVNNAGLSAETTRSKDPLEQYHEIIETNQHGVYYGIQHSAQKMVEIKNGGTIVNLASVMAYLSTGGAYAYSSSKAAIVIMTKIAAHMYAEHNIHVVGVAPAGVNTPMLNDLGEEQINYFRQQMHGGQLLEPEDIAELIYFLSSSKASAVNGSTVFADDGYLSFK